MEIQEDAKKSISKKGMTELIFNPKKSIGRVGLKVFINKINPTSVSAKISKYG